MYDKANIVGFIWVLVMKMLYKICSFDNDAYYNSKDSDVYKRTPSQLILGLHPANETSLQSKAVSHWLGANLSAMSMGDVYKTKR